MVVEQLWLSEHAHLVRKYGEDVADEAFARLQSKPTTTDPGLLWGIAGMVAKEQYRTEKKQADLSVEPCLGGISIPSIETAIFRVDFDRAFRQLPDEQREAFALIELRGLTERETADVLGVSQPTVHRRCEAARTYLREELS